MKRFAFCFPLVMLVIFASITSVGASEPGDTVIEQLNGNPVYITTRVAGTQANAGSHHVPEAAGRTCNITVTAVNANQPNPSIRPDTSFVFSSNGSSVTATGIESTPGATVTTGQLTISNDGLITVTADSGLEGLFSAGYSATLSCGPIPHQPEPVITGNLVCEDETTWRVEVLTIEGSYLESSHEVGSIVDSSSITVTVTYDDGVYETEQVTEVISAESPDCNTVEVTVPPTTAPPSTTTPPTTAPPATTAPPTTAAPEETTTSTAPPVTETTISTTAPQTTAPPATTPPPTTPSGDLPNTGSSTIYFVGGGLLLILIGALAVMYMSWLSKHGRITA